VVRREAAQPNGDLHGQIFDEERNSIVPDASMRQYSNYEFDELADKHGFLVVYPDGFDNTWNDCRGGSPFSSKRLKIDDAGFISWPTASLPQAAAESRDVRLSKAGISAAGTALLNR
jgi:poly(3-hydroxybutyrate) depolymerase